LDKDGGEEKLVASEGKILTNAPLYELPCLVEVVILHNMNPLAINL